MSTNSIAQINDVIAEYFKTHSEDYIPVKDIMPALINAGIFTKDTKKGLPFRKILRTLDQEDSLDKIPFVHAERIEKNTYWYLVREGAKYAPKEATATLSKKQLAIRKRVNSDEHYILNLCDELLNDSASRQHRFPFLLGDFHKDKISRTKLPVDGYYQTLNLVIEYRVKHSKEDVDIDKAEVKTTRRVTIDAQRKIYDLRKRDVLERKNINLIEINYYAFEYDSDMNIVRNKNKDIEIVKGLIANYIK